MGPQMFWHVSSSPPDTQADTRPASATMPRGNLGVILPFGIQRRITDDLTLPATQHRG